MATLNETLVCNDEMDEAFDTYEESLNLSEYSSGQSTFDSGNFYRLSAISCRPRSAYFHWGYMCIGEPKVTSFCRYRTTLSSDCESDYDLPGPPLRIDESPDLNTTVTESFASSENVCLQHIGHKSHINPQFNTIRPANTSVDSFLKIGEDDKYKQSDYHYDNLDVSSRTASFKKSTSFDVPDGQLQKPLKTTGPSFESLRRRCLSAPNLKLMNNCFKCENCSGIYPGLSSSAFIFGWL